MFRSLTIHGGVATIIWGGYQTVATLRGWRIVKDTRGWTLTATLAGPLNGYASRRTPLYFTAARERGRWCFPVVGELAISGTSLTAPLGNPEQ
jgi:hypothetical protein